MIPNELFSAIKWIAIISCIAWWLKHIIKDLIDFLIAEKRKGGN